MDSSLPSCFFAYPSKPESHSEAIEAAIKDIDRSKVVHAIGWKTASVAGKFIINTICQKIEKCDVFICDLTYLNHNVLFELGFAISKNKRIWLIHNTQIEDSINDYKNFTLLTTVGYRPYVNSKDIIKAFFDDEPFKTKQQTIFKEMIEPYLHQQDEDRILYLKAAVETEASIRLTRLINQAFLPAIIDDPGEVRIQSLTWYPEKIIRSFLVVAHFLSQDYVAHKLHNAKCSFISGLSFGLGKNLLMLAHEPFVSPVDYQDLLKIHATAAKCEDISLAWIREIEHKYKERVVATKDYSAKLKQTTELQQISMGEPVAELEQAGLVDYFVQTSAYLEALSSKHSIFVGRKGSGKTAILLKVEDELCRDPRNHVCKIMPVGYELDGIVRMVEQVIHKSEKGFLMEAFWKFLIYTELAKSVYETIQSKPIYYQRHSSEKHLEEFVNQNSDVVLQDFSVRLESIVNKIKTPIEGITAAEQRLKISELMHTNIIKDLRVILGVVFENKNRVAVLIDNLDKSWNSQQNPIVICDLIHALLDVSRTISNDYNKPSKSNLHNFSISLFLRSDIFHQVLYLAPEPDKLTVTRLIWNDKETLLNVLEQRFLCSNPLLKYPSEIWLKYFCGSVKGLNVRDYLFTNILPRPRDLIYLVKTALTTAVNRGHSYITEDDLIEAQRVYSQYALDNLDAENAIRLPHLLNLLYEFVGQPEIVTREEILKFMNSTGIGDHMYGEVVELLCNLAFLGLEVEPGRFEYQFTETDEPKQKIMARRLVQSRSDHLERFKIAKPFHSFLEIVAC